MNNIDQRGWVTLGLFALTGAILAMIFVKPEIAKDEFFTTLAGAIVITGLINGVVSYLFGASKKEPQANPPPNQGDQS